MQYDPRDWYWLADDGRVFASARLATVDKGDADFAAFKAVGGAPTRWPTDDAGEQTDASLDAVLRPYGLSTKGVLRKVTGYALISALTDDQVKALATAKTKDQRLLSARVDLWPEDNPKIARIAIALSIKPSAWFDAALGTG